ncbi:baeRF11 domain-containing protein [Roseomonas rosulenta]|uniref:baeRF11 domain-containing protein n=1 Tax=Roseomonas rosulenta TaxID=2748667 RepID=UPI0018E02593|nr:hypothetical protein [Roseomonas rosulenta]
MLHVDIPASDELRSLLDHRDPVSVSIYLPTTPLTQEVAASRIALGNLSREAEAQLAAAGADRRAVAALVEHLHDLGEDDDFWAVQARSLAILATPERLHTYRLPNTLSEMVEVSDRFHMKPLLRAVTFPQAAYVLALAAGGVRVLEVSADLPVVQARVPGLPRDAASAVGKSSIKDRSHSQRIHGSEGEKVRLRQYARQVEQALRDLLRGSEVPLILAASDTLAAIYRSVNTYPHLANAGILDSPETMTDAQLAEAARGVLDGLHAETAAAWRARFAERSGQGRGTTDIAVAARAAVQGAVDSVMVDIDGVVPGSVDPQTGAVTFAAADDAVAYGVVDEIARLTLHAGGRVLAVRRADIPGGAQLAAILRYPLG